MQQAKPPGSDGVRAAEMPLKVPPATVRKRHLDVSTQHATTPLAGAIADKSEMVKSGSAGPATTETATALAANNIPASQAMRTAVSKAFMANFRYPRIARRNGWEGTVTLTMRVLPDGQLTDILVSSSSGHSVLDLAAVHTLQTARVPQAKHWLSDQAVELLLPVEYRLLDS